MAAGFIHNLLIDRTGAVQCKPVIKRVTQRSVQYFINIPLSFCVIAGMKILGNLSAGMNSDIHGKVNIQGNGKLVTRNPAFRFEAYTEARSVNTGVSSGTALDIGLPAKNGFQSFLKLLLNGYGVLLYLPAVISGPQKTNGKKEISHFFLPSVKGSEASSEAKQEAPARPSIAHITGDCKGS